MSATRRSALYRAVRNRWAILMHRYSHSSERMLNNPLMRPAKKIIVTIAGLLMILTGVLLIVLPGPAMLFIPLGLVILATEYPIAKKWLRKFQRMLTASAKKADDFFARRRKN